MNVNIASPGAEAYEVAECVSCGVIDPQEDIAIHEGGHNIQNEVCEECFRVAPIEAQGVTGRWVAIPPLGEEDCDTPEKYERWERTIQEPDRLYLSGDDIHARDFGWEWVPYEPDQIPIACGNKVSWRGA